MTIGNRDIAKKEANRDKSEGSARAITGGGGGERR